MVASDTLVETPLVIDHVNKSLASIGNQAKRDNLPITTHKVLPKPDKTFWACLLGKGYPAPTQSFRWCTERMKIDPVSDFIKDKVAKHDEVIVILGSRSQESASRAQVIAKHKIENTRLARHTTLANAFIYTPIDTWSMDDVWKILRACSLEVTISPMGIGKKWLNKYELEWENPWGSKNMTLWNLYKDSSDQGECPMVIDDSTPSCGNSRFGCWTCTVVSKDRAMESLIKNGEEWMLPLLEFREKLAITTIPEEKATYRNFKRRTGKVSYQRAKSDEELTKDRAHVPGPYMMRFRKEWLQELLNQEKNSMKMVTKLL
ncbi:phosphoadenosine phosphosulfate reductase family protein [Psychromonas sp. KJ10-10]|uniref:phosphoadenosine phosphosulfate reductase domain-containing protein n=1 Tax=Psychromonas sp. KJ10-10 TaxID=3391823 RepID=UPI0039B3DEFE